DQQRCWPVPMAGASGGRPTPDWPRPKASGAWAAGTHQFGPGRPHAHGRQSPRHAGTVADGMDERVPGEVVEHVVALDAWQQPTLAPVVDHLFGDRRRILPRQQIAGPLFNSEQVLPDVFYQPDPVNQPRAAVVQKLLGRQAKEKASQVLPSPLLGERGLTPALSPTGERVLRD